MGLHSCFDGGEDTKVRGGHGAHYCWIELHCCFEFVRCWIENDSFPYGVLREMMKDETLGCGGWWGEIERNENGGRYYLY